MLAYKAPVCQKTSEAHWAYRVDLLYNCIKISDYCLSFVYIM